MDACGRFGYTGRHNHLPGCVRLGTVAYSGQRQPGRSSSANYRAGEAGSWRIRLCITVSSEKPPTLDWPSWADREGGGEMSGRQLARLGWLGLLLLGLGGPR